MEARACPGTRAISLWQDYAFAVIYSLGFHLVHVDSLAEISLCVTGISVTLANPPPPTPLVSTVDRVRASYTRQSLSCCGAFWITFHFTSSV